jgi:hypothetical protein
LSSSSSPPAVDDLESARQKALEERFEREAEAQRKKREQDQEAAAAAAAATEQKQTKLIPKLRTAEEAEADEDKGVIFDKKKYPGISQAEYQRYWDTVGAQRSAFLTQYAKQTNFLIPLYSAKNSKLDDVDADLTDDDVTQEIGIEQKEFRFHDATTAQWDVIQELDYDITEARRQAIQIAEAAAKNKTPIPKEEMEHLKETLREKDRKKYRYCAKIFFRMTGDQIDRADQRRLKDAVDAAIHRTITTIPNYSKISNQPFT